MRKFKTSLVIATALCSGWGTSAYAQDDQGEEATSPNTIIVTARRTEERLQDVPVAVSVITPAAIEAKGSFTSLSVIATT